MLHAPARSGFIGIVAALLLSGCASNDGEVSPTTSQTSLPPAPKVVLADFAAHACPGAAPPVQTASLRQRFVVDDGYDRIIVEYGETGEGQVMASIRFVEENKNVWIRDQHPVNTVAEGVACGAHGSHGPGDEVTVDPGEYEASIQYTGTVDVVMSVTARSSRGNMTDHMDDHSG